MAKAPATDTYETGQWPAAVELFAFVTVVAIIAVTVICGIAYVFGQNRAAALCHENPAACIVHQPKEHP
jgi:hypothetical protein